MKKKIVYIVAPYAHRTGSNFKQFPYKAWLNIGGNETKSHYLPSYLKGIEHHIDFPTINIFRNQCTLRLVEACTLSSDCFPDYMWCETIPLIWDCWPHLQDKTAEWIERHEVKLAIFTSSQVAEQMKGRLPNIKILTITEGIDTSLYHAGGLLKNRDIDLLEYGNVKRNFFRSYIEGIKHINVKNSNGLMATWDELLNTMSRAKLTVALPRCDVDNEFTGGVETLTQRFWEGMLSRTVIIGRAPNELLNLIGYNPLINIDYDNPVEQVKSIIRNISDYQSLVDKNRDTALRLAPWEIRMRKIMDWLEAQGYQCVGK